MVARAVAPREVDLPRRSLIHGWKGAVSSGKSTEETVWLPGRTGVGVGDPQEQDLHQMIELCCAREINRLIQVVRRRMIAVLHPVSEKLLVLGTLQVAVHGEQRRDAFLDEAVLITSDEQDSIRFILGMGLDPVLPADIADVITEGRFFEPLDFPMLERAQGKESIQVEVGDDWAGHSRVVGIVLGTKQSLLFPCHH